MDKNGAKCNMGIGRITKNTPKSAIQEGMADALMVGQWQVPPIMKFQKIVEMSQEQIRMTTFSHRIVDNLVFVDEVVEISIGVRRQMSGPEGTEEIIDGACVDKAVANSQEREMRVHVRMDVKQQRQGAV